MQTTRELPATSTRQWLAALLRAAAKRIDGEIIQPPTVREIRQGQLYDAEVALLGAESEAERAAHTVNMLRERLNRLRQ